VSKRATAPGMLIAVDGVDAPAVLASAKTALAASPASVRGGISRWDASGVFQDLAVAHSDAGQPSARTLLLLYAADLAFRLRWQIKPALAEGRTVVAAPYIETAMAFGRAAGLPAKWLVNLFSFAPRAADRQFVLARDAQATAKDGFVGFVAARIAGRADDRSRRQIVDQTATHLRTAAQRRKPAKSAKKS
jgi:thymidylate kinase